MKEINFNSGNGWCYVSFDGKKQGLVSYDREEILPCEFDYVSTHIGELHATVQYKNVLCRLFHPIPQNQEYLSYEDESYFIYGENGLFSIEIAPSFLVEEFCNECAYNGHKEPEIDQNIIDRTFTELCELLSKNHYCTKEEFEKRRKSL